MLAVKNAHKRDRKISMHEPTHVYTVAGESNYTSVTTFIHSFFPHFDADLVIEKMRNGRNWNPDNKYFHLTNDQIKKMWKENGVEASALGTKMHEHIENFYNGIPFPPTFVGTREHELFQQFYKDHENYMPYRTEWMIYSKKYRLSGSIDMIYVDPNDPDKIVIADWKRSKEIKMENKWEKGHGPLSEIDNCNFWHYTLQLNIYKMILEANYGKKVSGMFLVILHPNQEKYIKIDIPTRVDLVLKMLATR